ncbi:MAG: hypothetical protein AUH81_10620 [Candidatus Rokubacteria bacterium 13_1_40CM_4_69_5]|nr:MAG: hypothetical protein AUH81_10620 [Candidatus Rokubacteria bacterium 13_1_40CM_4_69_5]
MEGVPPGADALGCRAGQLFDDRLTGGAHPGGTMASHRNNALRLATLAVIGAACASTGGMRSVPLDAGEVKFYGAPLATVAPAARQAVLAAGLEVDTVSQEDSLTWMIVAKKGMSLFSYGELVRVVVHQTTEGPVAVRVFTKRRLATNVTAKGDWSGPIYENLDHILAP